MDNALSPREIQARIRGGDTVAAISEESGMDLDRVEVFAGPVLAEREHIATAALSATIRRRGEAGSHRRLGELIAHRLRSRGLDADDVTWDAWRQPDLKWRVVGRLGTDEAEARVAEFIYDAKGRYSVADNLDARWMIGEEAPGAAPEEENTVDFQDELALVRAVQGGDRPAAPGDDVPEPDLMHDGNEDTSQLDRLYDMLSGISEDSVRIYTGFFDDAPSPEPTDDEPVAADDEPVAADDDDLSVDDLAPEDDEAAAEADEAQEPVDEEPPGEAEAQVERPAARAKGPAGAARPARPTRAAGAAAAEPPRGRGRGRGRRRAGRRAGWRRD